VKTYTAIATDYDGTVAYDGRVDGETLAALRHVKSAGIALVLVTGRELSDLGKTFPEETIFDRIVAENGAVLSDPASATVSSLAAPPSAPLLERLAERNVPVSVGQSIIATVEPHRDAVVAAIHELGLDWHIVLNKRAVMALPSGVTKASGLAVALEALGISPEQTIGIGDAENDQAFLEMCGLAVAVANALPSIKAAADLVTDGARGCGVVELIDRLLADDLSAGVPRRRAHRGTSG
jgi:hydroxymethylpyrimidine pyrophosphatase-like HAD family hydrolase